MLIDLPTIKKHLNLDPQFTEDDTYIEYLEGVAIELVQKDIDQPLEELKDESDKLPQPLIHAMLYLIGNMYESRESLSYTSVTEKPCSLTWILRMYRDYNNANI
jgi:hypothetical protein